MNNKKLKDKAMILNNKTDQEQMNRPQKVYFNGSLISKTAPS